MLKIAVLVSGGGTNLQAIIDAIEAGEITDTTIEVVISNRKNAYALERARQHGIKTQCLRPKDYDVAQAFADALIDCLQEHEVELVVLAGYLVILHEKVIRQYKTELSMSIRHLIPAFSGDGFYGLKVHEAALERGVKVSGATVHVVDEITDHGPILYQQCVPVYANDTPKLLQERIMEEAEWKLLPKAINTFEEWFDRLSE